MDRRRIMALQTKTVSTAKGGYSIVLTLIDTGMGSYIKGRVECDFVKCGGTCPKCPIADDFADISS